MQIDFFDVPVYRISEDAYYEAREKQLLRKSQSRNSGPGLPKAFEERMRIFDEEQFHEKYGPWNYNEIIAYIRLHLLGDQIRGEYVSAEKQHNLRSRNKVFTWRDWKLADEMDLPSHATNSEIYSIIELYLDDCEKELTTGRFIDRSGLRMVGRHIDWRSLFDLSKLT